MAHATHEVWEAIAPQYDDWYATSIGAFALRAELDALFALAGAISGRRVLEVGCGTGQFARELARRGARVVGVDRAEGMLQVAARKGEGAVQLCRAMGERLPFAAGTFDLVLAVTVLEFVNAPRAILNELWRALRPGGRLVVGVLNPSSPWARTWRNQPPESPYAQARYLDARTLAQLLREFGPVTWRGAVFVPPSVREPKRLHWRALERVGSRFLPLCGAFIAARLEKPALVITQISRP